MKLNQTKAQDRIASLLALEDGQKEAAYKLLDALADELGYPRDTLPLQIISKACDVAVLIERHKHATAKAQKYHIQRQELESLMED